MMASALLEQLNHAIDQQQMAISNHAASFKYDDIERLQKRARSVMQLIAENGDRNLTLEEQNILSAPLK